MAERHFICQLKNRAILILSGEDRYSFIQGLITNDIDLLKTQSLIYACLLTPQGKYLFDFFIYEQGEALYLDVEAARFDMLVQRLSMYRLRSKVTITPDPEMRIYALWGSEAAQEAAHHDPRKEGAGYRLYTSETLEESASFEDYDRHRIALCLPDGSRDLVPEMTTMAEANMDDLRAVSYKKGCYVGQEITARMHHRGLAKKHLYTIAQGQAPFPVEREAIMIDGTPVGEMRSSCGDIGIALIKDEAVPKVNEIYAVS